MAETGFMKFVGKHIEYPACNAMIDYQDMKKLPGFARNFIIEHIRIPEYKRMIKQEAEKANKYAHIKKTMGF